MFRSIELTRITNIKFQQTELFLAAKIRKYFLSTENLKIYTEPKEENNNNKKIDLFVT